MASLTSLVALQELHKQKLQALESKKTTLGKCTEKTDALRLNAYQISIQRKDLDDEFFRSCAVLDTLQSEMSLLQPQIRDLKDVAAPRELIDSVQQAEKKLREVNGTVLDLEKDIQTISKKYYQEQESTETFLAMLNTRIVSLQDALKKKVAVTYTSATNEKQEPIPHPNEALAALETLTKEREQEALNVSRQLRELQYISEAKEIRKAQLEAESVSQVDDIATIKDEEIRSMVHQIHQERDMILNDIQDVRVVNREQAFNLRRGQVQKDRGNTVVFNNKSNKQRTPTRTDASASGPSRSTLRQAHFRQEPKPSEGEVVLTKANEALNGERADLTTRMHRSASDKSDLLKSIKVAKENAKKEAEQRRQLLRELEMQALAAKRKSSQLEDENMKLEETCDALSTTLKSTKQQYMQLSDARAQILPAYELQAIEA